MSVGDITFQVGDILFDPTHIFQMTTDLNVINMCPIAKKKGSNLNLLNELPFQMGMI